jgi:hypothetical protein
MNRHRALDGVLNGYRVGSSQAKQVQTWLWLRRSLGTSSLRECLQTEYLGVIPRQCRPRLHRKYGRISYKCIFYKTW